MPADDPAESAQTLVNGNAITSAASKRKRSESTEVAIRPPAPGASTPTVTAAEKARRRKDAIGKISNDLLAVLKDYDLTPSILHYSLSSIDTQEPSKPPLKRPKLSEPIPDTIGERLATASYASFNVFLSDVSAVCRSLQGTLSAIPKSNNALGNGSTSWENVNTLAARVLHFEILAKDLVNRQRKRLAHDLDFTEELAEAESSSSQQEPKKAAKVALAMETRYGSFFTSLPKADEITVPSIASSRSTSATGSPKSPASTAATDVSDWKPKVESIQVRAPFVEPSLTHPLVSIVEVASEPEGALNKEPPKQTKLGEVFAPPPALLHQQEPRPDFTKMGIKWGGGVGPGGIIARPELETRERVSDWLQYTNHPKPGMFRIPLDPYRQGIGLPANFVAAYSSFAPTRDDSHTKVPTAISNATWWRRRGGKVFRRMFADEPSIGHMFKAYDPSLVNAGEEEEEPAAAPKEGEKASTDLDEKELESLITNIEDLPLDTRLVIDTDIALAEISTLLSTLSSQQYTRLAKSSKPHDPASEELRTYNALHTRLATLISSLPPHVAATIDGHRDSPLSLSSRIPTASCTPPFFGNLPDEKPQQHLQQAAMTAMNAAAGLAPAGLAPVASMMPPQHRVQGAPHLSLYPQYQPTPPPPPQPQTPQRARGNVPPPQGLGAIGVGVGGGGYYSPRVQGTPRRR